MKKQLAFATACALTVLLYSCKKGDDSTSRASMIQGTWKTTEAGVDSNNNGAWDAAEHRAPTAAETNTLTFKSDGSGTQLLFGFSVPISWSLVNSDNDIRISTTVAGGDTVLYNIVSLTASDAVVRDISNTPVSYAALKKQ